MQRHPTNLEVEGAPEFWRALRKNTETKEKNHIYIYIFINIKISVTNPIFQTTSSYICLEGTMVHIYLLADLLRATHSYLFIRQRAIITWNGLSLLFSFKNK